MKRLQTDIFKERMMPEEIAWTASMAEDRITWEERLREWECFAEKNAKWYLRRNGRNGAGNTNRIIFYSMIFPESRETVRSPYAAANETDIWKGGCTDKEIGLCYVMGVMPWHNLLIRRACEQCRWQENNILQERMMLDKTIKKVTRMMKYQYDIY